MRILNNIGIFCSDHDAAPGHGGLGASLETVREIRVGDPDPKPLLVDLHTLPVADLTPAWADRIKGTIDGEDTQIATFIGALPGDNYNDGPVVARNVVGMSRNTPENAEDIYLAQAKFASEHLGCTRFGAHFGDFPAPGAPGFSEFVERVGELGKRMRDLGYKSVAAETGPEPAQHTAALIDAANECAGGDPIIFANLDTGNPVMWGTTLDVLEFVHVLGERIVSVHLKNAAPPKGWKQGKAWPNETELFDGIVPIMWILYTLITKYKYKGSLVREAEFFKDIPSNLEGEALAQAKHDARIGEWPKMVSRLVVGLQNVIEDEFELKAKVEA